MSMKDVALTRALPALFAALVACALAAVFAQPAYADNLNKGVANGGTFTIDKTYTVENGTAPAESFELTAALDSSSDVAVEADKAKDLTIAAADFDALTGNGTGTFTVTLPTYEGVGQFVYKVAETDNGTAGVTYSADDLYVVVQVTNKAGDPGNGLECNVAVHKGSATGDKVSGITNTYHAGSLAVTKNVTGNMGDKNKAFDVTVTFTAPEGKTVNSAIALPDGTTGQFSNGTLVANISLKDGQTLTFNNLPYGVTYTVVEGDYTGEGYDAAQYDNAEGTIDSATATATITNNKGVAVDTGIVLNNLPFIAVLAVAVAGIAALALRKRARQF